MDGRGALVAWDSSVRVRTRLRGGGVAMQGALGGDEYWGMRPWTAAVPALGGIGTQGDASLGLGRPHFGPLGLSGEAPRQPNGGFNGEARAAVPAPFRETDDEGCWIGARLHMSMGKRCARMPANTPTIYVIAGCNGAGKTTFAREFLPKEAKCLRFMNADEIARGLSPLKPSAGAIQAARLLLSQVRESLRRRETFALESTLSGKTYVRLFRHAMGSGYEIELHYLWLSSPAHAIARVQLRVRQGGHHVPATDVRRRFKRSLAHLVDDYLPLATRWAIWDSRTLPAKLLAISSAHDIEEARRRMDS